MIIYHGGTDIVKIPKILKPFAGRDFGNGFYTTDIRVQAVKWSLRQARIRRKNDAFLNSYELDEAIFENANIKEFEDYEMDWLNFVINCRQNINYNHEYDLVIGKVANDDVGETIQAVIDGLTSKEFALSRLAFMQANSQLCFSTEIALNYLKFITAEKVN